MRRRYVGTMLWIAYLVVPAPDLGLIHGLPLDPFNAFALLALGWLAVQGVRPGGARLIAGALAVVLLVPAVIPGTKGFRARYFANVEAREPFERSTDYPNGAFTRVDDLLDFSPGRAEFPLYFFNDVARFGAGSPGEGDPNRLTHPFAVEWDGYWRIEAGQTRTIYMDAPGASA